MSALRDLIVGFSLVAVLIAVASRYALDPRLQLVNFVSENAGAANAAAPARYSANFVDWTADGRGLVSVSRGEMNAESSLALHDTAQKSARMPIDIAGEGVASAAMAPDGRHVVAGTSRGQLWWIGLESLERTLLFEMPKGDLSMVTAVAVAAQGGHVAFGNNNGRNYLIDFVERASIELVSDRTSSVRDLHFSADGARLVGALGDGSIVVWDAGTGQALQTLKGHSQAATAAIYLPGERQIMSTSLDDSIRIWDVASSREAWRGEFGLQGVTTLALSVDGITAAWGGFNRKIIVWDLANRCKKFQIATPASIIWHLKFSPDGTTLAAAGMEGKIRFYDARDGSEGEGIPLGRDVEG